MLRITIISCAALIAMLSLCTSAQAAPPYRPPSNIPGLDPGFVNTQIGTLSVTCHHRANYFLGFFFRSFGFTYCTGHATRVRVELWCQSSRPFLCKYAVVGAGETFYGNYNMDNRTFHRR